MSSTRIGAATLVAALAISSASLGQEPVREGAESAGRAPSFVAASAPVQELRISLLEKRWNYSKENRAAAATEYAAIEASGEATPADRLLYGIVRFRQHEYAPSAALLTSALAAMPDDRLTLKTRIWTAAKRDELEVLWPLLSRFQKIVFARAKDPAVPAEDLLEDLVFLGQMHGFLAGPYGELDQSELLASLRDDVAAGLPIEKLSLLESAERGVLENYERFADEREALLAEAAAAEKAEAEAKRAELLARREDLEAEKAELNPARERVADGKKETLNALTEAEALVASSGEAIARQAENLRVEYNNALRTYLFQQEIVRDRIEQAEQAGRTVFFPGALENLAVLRANLRRIEGQMDLLQRENAGVQFQFGQIRQRRLAEEAELSRDLAKLQFDHAKLEKELARLEQETQQVDQPNRSNSALLREADKAMSSIDSYVDFSLEIPRDAALAALGRAGE